MSLEHDGMRYGGEQRGVTTIPLRGVMYTVFFTCLCSHCHEGLRGEVCEEWLSEVAAKRAHLEAPRPLEESSRRRW